MKICIVTTAFPRWPGDNRAPFIYNAAKAVQDLGHQVRVLAMHCPGAQSHETMEGIEVFRPRYLPDRFEIIQKDRGGIPSAWQTNRSTGLALIFFTIVHTLGTARYARNCDLIHANWTLSGLAALSSRPIHRKSYIVTVHGSDIFQGAAIPLVRFLTGMCLKRANRVIAVSSALARAVEDIGIPSNLVNVIPDGVDATFFHPPTDPREHVILFVGTLSKNKGIKYLLQAFAEVCHSFKDPDLRLDLVGDGPEKQSLMDLVKQLEIQSKVSFLGSLSQKEVSCRMRQSLLFVLPSLREGFGVVLLEALASGTPCIGSLTGGIPDIITPDVGRLVPPEKPVALKDAILEILQDPSLQIEMGKRARQKILDHFTWEIIGKQLDAIYKEVGHPSNF
jgi:glycosyltransferase involved in cell wall biosynthesis